LFVDFIRHRGGSAFTIWIISGPVSPSLIACARIFSSIAALPTSPFNAAVIWRLIANSNLDVFLVRSFSRYFASPLKSFARHPQFQGCDACVDRSPHTVTHEHPPVVQGLNLTALRRQVASLSECADG
jgi:hypothetical protein